MRSGISTAIQGPRPKAIAWAIPGCKWAGFSVGMQVQVYNWRLIFMCMFMCVCVCVLKSWSHYTEFRCISPPKRLEVVGKANLAPSVHLREHMR